MPTVNSNSVEPGNVRPVRLRDAAIKTVCSKYVFRADECDKPVFTEYIYVCQCFQHIIVAYK